MYLKFLDVLRKTGYEFLADLIVENEKILRREKEPFLSEQFQASNQTQEEIHPTPIPWSGTNIATQNSNLDSSSLESFRSSSMIYSGSSGSSIPISRSGQYSLIPQRKGLLFMKRFLNAHVGYLLLFLVMLLFLVRLLSVINKDIIQIVLNIIIYLTFRMTIME